MSDDAAPHFLDRCRERLEEDWKAVLSADVAMKGATEVPAEISSAIDDSINSKTLTYRYVLPTQLLAKAVDSDLDCRSVQAGCGLTGAFDARSVCHKVVVEFDRNNSNVLGGSKEPYLNNPLRIGAIVEDARKAQKDKDGFDLLRLVLDFAQGNPRKSSVLLHATLRAIRKRLEHVTIVYPVPNRISLKQVQTLLAEFLSQRTGGVRLQAVAVGLFRAIGERFHLFESVRSGNVNAADASTGSAADLECLDADDRPVMAVEVKDRQLTLHQAEGKLPTVRDKGIRELLFLVQGGVSGADREAIDQMVDRQFVTGQNIYVCDFSIFVDGVLVLFGEIGRRRFLQLVGESLDESRVGLEHRQRWRDLLQGL